MLGAWQHVHVTADGMFFGGSGWPTRIFRMVTLHFDLTRSYCFCFCWGGGGMCLRDDWALGPHLFIRPGPPSWLGGLPLPPKAKVLAQALEPELGQTAPSGEGEGMGVRLARGFVKLRRRRVQLFNVHFRSRKLPVPLNGRRNRWLGLRRPKPTLTCSCSGN